MNKAVSMVNTVTAANVTKEDWEVKHENKLDQAARVLTDELFPITDKLEKACLLLQDITEDYFQRHDPAKQEERFWIVWGFSRATTQAEIIFDYVIMAKKALEELEARADRAGEEKNLEATSY